MTEAQIITLTDMRMSKSNDDRSLAVGIYKALSIDERSVVMAWIRKNIYNYPEHPIPQMWYTSIDDFMSRCNQ